MASVIPTFAKSKKLTNGQCFCDVASAFAKSYTPPIKNSQALFRIERHVSSTAWVAQLSALKANL